MNFFEIKIVFFFKCIRTKRRDLPKLCWKFSCKKHSAGILAMFILPKINTYSEFGGNLFYAFWDTFK